MTPYFFPQRLRSLVAAPLAELVQVNGAHDRRPVDRRILDVVPARCGFRREPVRHGGQRTFRAEAPVNRKGVVRGACFPGKSLPRLALFENSELFQFESPLVYNLMLHTRGKLPGTSL